MNGVTFRTVCDNGLVVLIYIFQEILVLGVYVFIYLFI